MKRKFFTFTLLFVLFFGMTVFTEALKAEDKSSKALTEKAWGALQTKDYGSAVRYAEESIKTFKKKALEQQAGLKDFAPSEKAFDAWALNDVATCLFIKGLAKKEEGKTDEAKSAFKEIIDVYSFAQCWDGKKKLFWKVADAAQDQTVTIDSGLDFGNYTSETLTVKAWEALGAGNYDAVIVYTRKCIKLYGSKADEMQAKLDGYATKEKAFDYWALNDIGTCYFIMGDAYAGNKESQKALEAYKTLVEKYSYAQCWDPKGWFWKPAVAARGKVNKIMAETGMMY